MADATLGVAIYGTGRAGTEVCRACLHRNDVRIVAGIAVTASKQGADLGALTVGAESGVTVTCDLASVLVRPDVNVVLHTGLGDPEAVAAILGQCADAGKDAVTVAGLVHPPTGLGAAAARELDRRARAGGARVVGTGVNPGFLLDVLPAVLGSMVARVDRVRAARVSDIRNWGDGALEDEVGVGQPPAEVKGTTALSLGESLALIADALDIDLDRCEDRHEALPAPGPRDHLGRHVLPGETVGFRRRGLGYRNGALVVDLEWRAIFCLDPAVDNAQESASIIIEGDSRIEAECRGTFFGDPYPSTAARAINVIAPLRDLAPGLYRPDQLAASRKS